MTGVSTKDILKALNKTQLIDLILKMQYQMNSSIDSLIAEMKNLNNNSKRFEFDVQVVIDLKHRLNVVSTCDVVRRRIDVEMRSCIYREKK